VQIDRNSNKRTKSGTENTERKNFSNPDIVGEKLEVTLCLCKMSENNQE
jgi:hypothetical protein